jgi:PAS domain S-box-containing protein
MTNGNSERPQTHAEAFRAHLAAIVATSDDAIISKDLNGIIQTWNAAAERIFGYRAEEIIGRSILTIIPPDRQDEETQILNKLKRGERVDHIQTVRMRKDGRLIDISVTISPIKDATGKVIGASKIARDITEWKRLTHEREKLYELGKTMAGQFDMQSLVQTITDVATELCRAQFGAFFHNVKDAGGESSGYGGGRGGGRGSACRSCQGREAAEIARPGVRTGVRRSQSLAAGRLESAYQCHQIHAQGWKG